MRNEHGNTNTPTGLESADGRSAGVDQLRLRIAVLVDGISQAARLIESAQARLDYGRRQEGEEAQKCLREAHGILKASLDGKRFSSSEAAHGDDTEEAQVVVTGAPLHG